MKVKELIEYLQGLSDSEKEYYAIAVCDSCVIETKEDNIIIDYDEEKIILFSDIEVCGGI